MPAYNFKDRFVPLISGCHKLTTIRPRRQQRPTRIGDRLFLFNRQRSNLCRLIKDTVCVKLSPIKIYTGECPEVCVGESGGTKVGRHLTQSEVLALAQRDGFETAGEFFAFFAETYGPIFVGELIEWAP